MGKNFVDDLLVFNTGESLPRERGPAHERSECFGCSECFGYDLFGATTMSAGFYRAAFGSIENTLFNRCAQVMADRRSVAVLSCPIAIRPPLPRLAGVTRIRCLLFGANTL